MSLRPILRLLLAGLLAGFALLASVPRLDPRLPTLDPPSAHADGPNDWPMFGHDPAHTGYNPDETQLKPPLRLKWSYGVPILFSLFSSPAVVGWVVYVGSSDGKLYALDTATGASAGATRPLEASGRPRRWPTGCSTWAPTTGSCTRWMPRPGPCAGATTPGTK